MSAVPPFLLRRGNGKLILSLPHVSTYIPPPIAARMTETGRASVDTDWHVDRLYSFCDELDMTILTATHSRYFVDLNRSPLGGSLYPGQIETSVCPTESFDGNRLYLEAGPDEAEIETRVAACWQPYHQTLADEIARVKATHKEAHLLDGHSIRGELPRLFSGELPDLNFGKNDGASAGAGLTRQVIGTAEGSGFSAVLNGRFKGGYITRHYGRPEQGVHAIQLELAQRIYLDENAPTVFDARRAETLISLLRKIVDEENSPGPAGLA